MEEKNEIKNTTSAKINKSAKDKQLDAEKNKQVADTYAKMKGAESINEITDKARNMMRSEDAVEREMGRRLATETITDLAQLILYQEINTFTLPYEYDLVERTNDGMIENGNAKEYIIDIPTGNSTYNIDNFNPDSQTIKKLNKWIIQMYDANDTLNAKAFQYLKELTLPEGKWLPYFLSGKLNDFFSILRAQIYKSFKIFISNKLFNLITTNDYAKTIAGTETNMFDCLVKEVIPNINKLIQINSEYNVQECDALDTADMNDIIVIMSNRNKALIENGIKTQLFNAELLGPWGKLLRPENIVCLGNKLNVQGQDAIITDTKTEWVDDNTIFVVDISKIKTVYQINQSASQFYARNLTLYIALHIWGAQDILPWCKGFKYTNTNLSKLPDETPTAVVLENK